MTTMAQLFRAMIAARDELGRGEKHHLRFFVDDEIRRSHIRQNLPRGTDGNFDGYRKRISIGTRCSDPRMPIPPL